MQFLWQDWRTDLRDLRSEAERVVRNLLKISCKELWSQRSGSGKRDEELLQQAIFGHCLVGFSDLLVEGEEKEEKVKVTETISLANLSGG